MIADQNFVITVIHLKGIARALRAVEISSTYTLLRFSLMTGLSLDLYFDVKCDERDLHPTTTVMPRGAPDFFALRVRALLRHKFFFRQARYASVMTQEWCNHFCRDFSCTTNVNMSVETVRKT